MSAATSRAKGKLIGSKTDGRQAPSTGAQANSNGVTPLIRAVCDGSEQVVQKLIDQGADVNARRDDGFTSLLLAAFYGHHRIVRLLLDNGADVEIKSRFETGAEMWADARGFFAIGDELRKAKIRNAAPAIQQDRIRANFTTATASRPAPLPKSVTSGPDRPKEPALRIINSPKLEEPPPVVQELSVNSKADKNRRRVIDDTWDINPPIYEKSAEYRAAMVFVARITDTKRSLALFTLAVMLLAGGITFSAFKLRDRFRAGSATSVETSKVKAPVEVAKPSEVVGAENDASRAVAPAMVSETNEADGSTKGNHAPSKRELLNPEPRQSDLTRQTSLRSSKGRSESGSHSARRSGAGAGDDREALVVSDSSMSSEPDRAPAKSVVQVEPTKSTTAGNERRLIAPQKSADNQPSAPGMISPSRTSPKTKVIQWP